MSAEDRARNMSGAELTVGLIGGLAYGTYRGCKAASTYFLGEEPVSCSDRTRILKKKLGREEIYTEMQINGLQKEIDEMENGIRCMASCGKFSSHAIQAEAEKMMMKKQKLSKMKNRGKKIYSNISQLETLEDMKDTNEMLKITSEVSRLIAAPVKNGNMNRQIRQTADDLLLARRAQQSAEALLQQELLDDDIYETEEFNDPIKNEASDFVKSIMTEKMLDGLVPSKVPSSSSSSSSSLASSISNTNQTSDISDLQKRFQSLKN